jgi:hypothetical protein
MINACESFSSDLWLERLYERDKTFWSAESGFSLPGLYPLLDVFSREGLCGLKRT